MLLSHTRQNDWLQALFGEDATLKNLMLTNAKARGLKAGSEYAEGFREVKTFPRTGSFDLLPGYGA